MAAARLGRSRFPLAKIVTHFHVRDGDHNRLPDEEIVYSADEGIRYLRAQDLKDGEITADDPVYITRRYYESITRSHIKPGDLLFSIMGSIGNLAIVPPGFPPATANRAIGILVPREGEDQTLTRFVFLLLCTELGAELYERVKKGGLQKRTNLADVAELLFPLPPKPERSAMVAALDSARSVRREKLLQADALLDGLDSFVLDILGLPAPPPYDPSRSFAVLLKSVRGKRLDPPAYVPFAIPENPHRIPIEQLAKVASINANVAPRLAADKKVVPYVGLPECDLNDVREVSMRPYAEVKGRSIARIGDILFARIEPSIFNKKYVFVQHLGGNEHVYLSTEFYTVRAHGDEYDQRYLYAMFHSSFVFNQVRGKTTGTSGRRRLDPDMFASLLFPWPKREIRKKIADEVARRREGAHRLREEGNNLWEEAKLRFEEQLLGPDTSAEETKSIQTQGRRKQ